MCAGSATDASRVSHIGCATAGGIRKILDFFGASAVVLILLPVHPHGPPDRPRSPRRCLPHDGARRGVWRQVPRWERLRDPGDRRLGMRRHQSRPFGPLVRKRSGLRARPHRQRLQRSMLVRRYPRERGSGRAFSVRDYVAELGSLPLRFPRRSALSWRSVHPLRTRSQPAGGLRRRGDRGRRRRHGNGWRYGKPG
jgi:hypothetical protein